MGAYIANMAKPSCCEKCILQDGEMCFAIDDGGDGLSLFSLEDLRDFCIKRRDDCPLEEVDLVRCGECKWWDKDGESPYGYCHAEKHCHFSSNWEISIYRKYKADHFCSDGERRE